MSADDSEMTAGTSVAATPLLEVNDLHVTYETYSGTVPVVRGAQFRVDRGEILGFVGETGAGKSVIVMTLLRLLGDNGKVTRGSVMFDGRDILSLSEREVERIRGRDIGLIMQNARSALDPLTKVGIQVGTVYQTHVGASRDEARRKTLEMLRLVQLADPERVADARPDELSGGMAQRISIAMALVCQPKLLLADNPTSGLDVTVQAQVLDLLAALAAESGLATVLATSDLGIVAQYCDRVAVLYGGEIVEHADVETFFNDARHPYSLGLIAAASYIRRDRRPTEAGLEERLEADGCQFVSRCPIGERICVDRHPELVGASHRVRCHLRDVSRERLR
jgi:peptide/nickel transport system ATP-binding protein